MSAEGVLPWLLVAQGIMGGIDTIVNHEWIAGLPRRASARREIGLHAIREATYGALFIGLGWFAWHGALAGVVALLLALEVVVTTTDEFVENRTRVLPQNERVLHVFLTLNYGLIVAVLAPTLLSWAQEPTGLAASEAGWTRWALLLLGASSFAWSLRDLVAWRRLSAATAQAA